MASYKRLPDIRPIEIRDVTIDIRSAYTVRSGLSVVARRERCRKLVTIFQYGYDAGARTRVRKTGPSSFLGDLTTVFNSHVL